jgi:hypothetical protein
MSYEGALYDDEEGGEDVGLSVSMHMPNSTSKKKPRHPTPAQPPACVFPAFDPSPPLPPPAWCPTRWLKESPLPGIPIVARVPFLPMFRLVPRPPSVVLMPLLERLMRTPGAILIDLRNRMTVLLVAPA